MSNFKQNRSFERNGESNYGNNRWGQRNHGNDRPRHEMHKAICSDCGSRCEVPFKPTGGKPVLCSDCFGGNNRDEGRDNRRNNNRRDFGGREERTMHQATCSDCGASCEVPFKPTGRKPVLCSDCFGNNRDNYWDNRRNNDRRDFGGREERTMHQATCSDCGASCEVPFKPSSDKPVLCSECFGNSRGKKDNLSSSSTEILAELAELHEKYDLMSTKLDKVINFLESVHSIKEPAKKATVKKVVKKATAKKAAVKKAAVKKVAVKKVAAKKATVKKVAVKK